MTTRTFRIVGLACLLLSTGCLALLTERAVFAQVHRACTPSHVPCTNPFLDCMERDKDAVCFFCEEKTPTVQRWCYFKPNADCFAIGIGFCGYMVTGECDGGSPSECVEITHWPQLSCDLIICG